MSKTFHKIYLHFTTATKGRTPWIDQSMDARLASYIQGICANRKEKLIAFGAADDHIHLLIEVGVDTITCDLMKNIKQSTSLWIKKQYPSKQSFQWQSGYAAFSEDDYSLSRVKNYILNQREHHLTVSSDTEYQELLKEHGMVFDPSDPI